MPWQDINDREVERRRERLFERHGDAPVRTRHDSPATVRFEEWIDMSRAGYIGSAYALVRRSPDQLPPLTESMTVNGDEQERVLLVLGRGETNWGVPGGGQEGNVTVTEFGLFW